MLRKIVAGAMAALTALCGYAATGNEKEGTEKLDRIPKIHGVFRGRYEGAWPDYLQRFQVRNARVSLEGKILPELDYYFRVDLCDRGTMKFLDGWARWRFSKEFAVKAGRFRVPFAVDAFRGPGSYVFANRSFLGKEMANLRQVGIQLGYYGKSIPLTLEAGVFNSATSSDQEVWQKEMDYAVKASYRVGNVTVSASFLSMMPKVTRMNIVDGSVSWKYRTLLLEGEYQHLHYCGNGYKDVNAWLAFASYGIPVGWRPFDMWSFHWRFDAMSDHSSGAPDPDGILITDDAARRRITVGTTLACNISKVKAEIILDYEKYFFDSGMTAPTGQDNRIVAELVVKF